jgi:hypothetical protein
MIVRFQAALNYPIRDYFLEIRQQLRENSLMDTSRMSQVLDNRQLNEGSGKLRKLPTFPTGPGGWWNSCASF